MKYAFFGKPWSPEVFITNNLTPSYRIEGIVESRPLESAFETLCKQDCKPVNSEERHESDEKVLISVQSNMDFMKWPDTICHEFRMNIISTRKGRSFTGFYVFPDCFKWL